MIAQINTGRGFGGLVNYANDIAHKNTVIIASAGVSTTTNATIVASFKAQARMRPSLKNFVGHISLSFHPDDTPRLTNEFMAEVAKEYLRRRGIVNTQFVIFRHHDQPHGHVHVVYNRIDNDGNAIKGDCNFRASAAVTKALTREYGLTFGKGKRDVRRSHLKGRDAVKYQLYDTISAVLSHCHDWQTGLIPVFLKNEFMGDPFFWSMKSILTIHNLKFQGVWDIETLEGCTGFPKDLFTPDKLEYKKNGNMLKGGLVYADYITTVSDSYAIEIQSPEYGEGLNGLLYARRLDMQGIVNGIDYDVYNPRTDGKLYVNYDASDFRKKKWQNKTKLQQELGLTVDKKKYMIGLISRLTDQKGLDLIRYVMDRVTDEFTQFVVIGTGDPQYENMFRSYAWKYGDRISANICYSDDLAHKLYAAADAFLMPSRFEPCGLTQLISFRYGTVPIVRETGGLRDTVKAYNEYENSGDGFSFRNYNGEEMLNIINYSKHIYFDKKKQWNQMVDRGMANDYSWNRSRGRYEEIYDYLINR